MSLGVLKVYSFVCVCVCVGNAQYIAARKEWIADLVVYKDIGEGLFREEKNFRKASDVRSET